VLIGKPGAAKTSIATADPDTITVRDRDLCEDLMGRLTFTEFFFLLVSGREPTEQETYFLDLLLVAIAEHGLTPTALAARMTYDAGPESLQGAVAAGLLGCGSVVLGTAEECAVLLTDAVARLGEDTSTDEVASAMAAAIRAAGGKMPGFGHPLHQKTDPRTERILELADECGIAGRHIQMARAFPPAVAAAWGRQLSMNVSMAIAAVLLDLGFPAAMVKAIPILARAGGLLAHLAEEQQRPIGFLMASHGEAAIAYEKGSPNGGK